MHVGAIKADLVVASCSWNKERGGKGRGCKKRQREKGFAEHGASCSMKIERVCVRDRECSESFREL